jgi:hypothetical protein
MIKIKKKEKENGGDDYFYKILAVSQWFKLQQKIVRSFKFIKIKEAMDFKIMLAPPLTP